MTTLEELKKQPYTPGKNHDVTPRATVGHCVPEEEYSHLNALTLNEPPHDYAAAQTLVAAK
jgi:hypothetical protein